MKRLLVLLLIPLFSFGQTYDELLTISSEDTFQKVFIENDYEFYEERSDVIRYAFNLTKSYSTTNPDLPPIVSAEIWVDYFKTNKIFSFNFSKDANAKKAVTMFAELKKSIKSNCDYRNVSEGTVIYKCTESQIDIAAFKSENGRGYVQMRIRQ
tara:strand:+ start:3649 stop:4110 length:462 start_codon:yes stop_codon:yes gene_type:complete